MLTGTRLMLIDGHALVHRAFHALPEDLSTSSGEPTNAVLGFCNIVFKAIETLTPSHVIMALDRAAPTFRHEQFAEYKSTRPPTPRPLVPQFIRVRQVAEALNIPIYELDGYEADDVLGTLSLQAEVQGIETMIVTGDLDALQLVSDRVTVLTPRRGPTDTELYDRERVQERYGIQPSQLPDWKALVGDTSDNIPGVPGIGAKTASKLFSQYSRLETLLDALSDLPERQRQAISENRDQAFRSRALATIVRDAPVELSLKGSARSEIDRARLLDIFRELEFWQLIRRVQDSAPRPAAVLSSDALARDRSEQLTMFSEMSGEMGRPRAGGVDVQSAGWETAVPRPDTSAGTDTRVVISRSDLEVLCLALARSDVFAFDTETTGTDPLRASLVGLSFALEAGHAWYIPVGHSTEGPNGPQLPLELVLQLLRPVLEDAQPRKVGHNLKYDIEVLHEYGITVNGLLDDTMLAAYLLSPSGRGLSLSALALTHFNIDMIPIESLIGRGKSQISMAEVDLGVVAVYAGEDADVTLRLHHALAKGLAEKKLESLLRNIEIPLVPVLARMEATGIALDTSVLTEMSGEMTEGIGQLEGKIYELAGRRFNIKSTQQLGQLLFQEMQLPSGRRTKTGFSTDNEVLEGLRDKHEIVDAILDFRQLIKLRDTYVDALPSLINPRTGRVHTDFNQAIAATGRLSSSNPNLQNIPIRGDMGRKIRRAFVPAGPDHLLLAVDYSQIELRILASMSGDERLLHAFLSGEDIHRATASAVFEVPLNLVTPDQRRIAKVVNFGIIYGIGEARLARETGIARAEATEFIANYNRTYAGVKEFMDAVKRKAYHEGFVSTLVGRRREFADLHSQHPGIRQAAERAAINMPVQGTAADIIKIAMIRLDRVLQERFPGCHMVLQVHDELVFDVLGARLDEVVVEVQQIMEHALELRVPLEVEMKIGKDWYDMTPLERVAA